VVGTASGMLGKVMAEVRAAGCHAGKESPGDTILPGSAVFASAADMASLDVTVANCCGVMLPVRSATSWSASCTRMHTPDQHYAARESCSPMNSTRHH